MDPFIESLLLLLDDPDPNIVQYSIDALSNHPTPELESRLRQLVSDDREPVSAAAVTGLARLHPGSEGALLTEFLVHASPVVRRQAVTSLSDGVDQDHVPQLLEILTQETHPQCQATLLGLLARYPEDVTVESILPLLQSPDDRVRANALDLLSFKDLSNHDAAVMALVDDDSPRVRASAMGALWTLHREAFVARLEGELAADDPEQLSASIHLLGFLPDYPRVHAVLSRFLDVTDVRVRRQAALSLVSLNQRVDCQDLFDHLLDETDPEVRDLLQRLARVGCTDSLVDQIAQVLEAPDADPRRRATAARVLGGLGSPRGIPALLNALSDEEPRIRANAVEALGHTDDPQLIDVIMPLVADSRPRVAANASIAIWRLGGQGVIERLGVLLGSRDMDEQLSAIYALGEIGMVEFMKPLNDLLDRLSGGVVLTDGQKRLQKNIHRAMDKIRARGTDPDASS